MLRWDAPLVQTLMVVMLEPPPRENCKGLTVKSKVNYVFPTSPSSADLFIHHFSEGLEMRKIIAHGIRMQSNLQTRAQIYAGSKSKAIYIYIYIYIYD